MKRTSLLYPSAKYSPRFSIPIEQSRFFVRGLLILLGLLCLVLIPRLAAASSGVFQESLPTSTLEIKYKNPAAGQVALVWGVNSWQILPEENRPAGTELRNGNMFTPMSLEGDSFIVRLQLPAWTTVDYGFLTTQDQNGNPVNVWEANGDKDFQTVTTETDNVVEIQAAWMPGGVSVGGGSPAEQLVNLNIEYTSPTSGEVFLIWGLNGWALASKGEQPTGTITKGNVMHTPMLKDEGVFLTRLQVAPGSVVDFGFLTTKDSQGEVVEVWEANGADDYHVMVNQDTVQKVHSRLGVKTGRKLPNILFVGLYLIIGLILILIVGFVFRRTPG